MTPTTRTPNPGWVILKTPHTNSSSSTLLRVVALRSRHGRCASTTNFTIIAVYPASLDTRVHHTTTTTELSGGDLVVSIHTQGVCGSSVVVPGLGELLEPLHSSTRHDLTYVRTAVLLRSIVSPKCPKCAKTRAPSATDVARPTQARLRSRKPCYAVWPPTLL